MIIYSSTLTGSLDITGSATLNNTPVIPQFGVTSDGTSTGTLDLKGVTSIGGYDFYFLSYQLFGNINVNWGCTLINTNDVQYIGTYSFLQNYCLTGSATFNNLKYVGYGAFQQGSTAYPSFTSFTAPNCSNIGPNAFFSNGRLISASIGSNTTVSMIAGVAFAGASSLSYVYIPTLSGSNALGGTPTSTNVFQNTALSGSITVPSFYSSSNAGSPDGDIAYLISRAWTVTYV